MYTKAEDNKAILF